MSSRRPWQAGSCLCRAGHTAAHRCASSRRQRTARDARAGAALCRGSRSSRSRGHRHRPMSHSGSWVPRCFGCSSHAPVREPGLGPPQGSADELPLCRPWSLLAESPPHARCSRDTRERPCLADRQGEAQLFAERATAHRRRPPRHATRGPCAGSRHVPSRVGDRVGVTR